MKYCYDYGSDLFLSLAWKLWDQRPNSLRHASRHMSQVWRERSLLLKCLVIKSCCCTDVCSIWRPCGWIGRCLLKPKCQGIKWWSIFMEPFCLIILYLGCMQLEKDALGMLHACMHTSSIRTRTHRSRSHSHHRMPWSIHMIYPSLLAKQLPMSRHASSVQCGYPRAPCAGLPRASDARRIVIRAPECHPERMELNHAGPIEDMG